MIAASTLPGEHLAALARAGEDRLQRPVVAFRGDDVPGDEGGDQRKAPDRHEEEDDEGHGETGVADVAAERDVVGAAGLENEHDDEDDRDERGRAEAEVGPLLREQLGDLPAVDPGDGAHQATASARSWSLDSPPVSPRNSSSRLAVAGTSAVSPMRAWPSAIVSAATASSSALNASSSPSSVTSSIPGCERQSTRARSGSEVRSR